ncbi:hypothetical protein [Maritimibacter sp. DP1N21-5]|uniref:hypothetical protein n=1 Tax=Maritimibacter sp. DP1N21-5 TaxID=2836867 RepID=UPI001C44C74C|nr:hypothetical protein [Maritimibacter sp. DP1N21-5]MBV7409539.1 hypothetical protein [Maritimibacter sp. DP1N21-5]
MRPEAVFPAAPTLAMLPIILSAVLIFVAMPGWSQTGEDGWQVFPTEDNTECIVGRTEAPYTLFFEMNFNDDDRHALIVVNKAWSLERVVELARLELVGRGGISVPTVFGGNRISLVFPAKDDANNALLLTELGKAEIVEVQSDRLPDGGKVSVPVTGFKDMLTRHDLCLRNIENTADLAAINEERARVTQAICDNALNGLTLLVMLTSNYTPDQEETIGSMAEAFAKCDQPFMGQAVRAALLDKDYSSAAAGLGDLCGAGYVPACHFAAVLGGYGKNPRVTPVAARTTLERLCDDGLQISCRVHDEWNR